MRLLTAEAILDKHTNLSMRVKDWSLQGILKAMQEYAAQETAEKDQIISDQAQEIRERGDSHAAMVKNLTDAAHKLMDQLAEKDKELETLTLELNAQYKTVESSYSKNEGLQPQIEAKNKEIARLKEALHGWK